MKKRNVIHPSALPTRSPVLFTVVLWLLLDRLQAPGWVSGVVWTLMALVWISAMVDFWWAEVWKPLRGYGRQADDGDAEVVTSIQFNDEQMGRLAQAVSERLGAISRNDLRR